jgi:hypothetical protein
MVDTDEVLGDVTRAKNFAPPLHFDQVNVAFKLDRTIDLLNDALTLCASECERFT